MDLRLRCQTAGGGSCPRENCSATHRRLETREALNMASSFLSSSNQQPAVAAEELSTAAVRRWRQESAAAEGINSRDGRRDVNRSKIETRFVTQIRESSRRNIRKLRWCSELDRKTQRWKNKGDGGGMWRIGGRGRIKILVDQV